MTNFSFDTLENEVTEVATKTAEVKAEAEAETEVTTPVVEEATEIVTTARELTFDELEAQKQALEEELRIRRDTERAGAINQIKTLIARFGLKASEYRVSVKTAPKKKAEPKYQDPVTGSTWTGRGKAPAWIKDIPVEQRSAYLIKK